jgi:hypothetical protein
VIEGAYMVQRDSPIRRNEPKSGSYPAAVSWADGSQGGSGRVILATT